MLSYPAKVELAKLKAPRWCYRMWLAAPQVILHRMCPRRLWRVFWALMRPPLPVPWTMASISRSVSYSLLLYWRPSETLKVCARSGMFNAVIVVIIDTMLIVCVPVDPQLFAMPTALDSASTSRSSFIPRRGRGADDCPASPTPLMVRCCECGCVDMEYVCAYLCTCCSYEWTEDCMCLPS